MKAVTVRVPAKLNLQLAVGPPRADGYHDLVTIFHAISLFDEITVEPADDDSVTVTGEGAEAVPQNDENLALRAVRALRETGLAEHGAVRVAITKRIPVAAGLAGGSANAAGVLVACNELWGAGLSQQGLCEIAGRVGSDVAFAVVGGTAVGRGRGELLSPALVRASARYHWVLAFADGQLATPDVYKAFDRLSERDRTPAPPELNASLMSALRGGDAKAVGAALSNDLEPAAVSLFPQLRKTLTAGRDLGALGALVSGSGPTCFFLAANASRALDLAAALSGAGVCRSVARATGPVPGATIMTGLT